MKSILNTIGNMSYKALAIIVCFVVAIENALFAIADQVGILADPMCMVTIVVLLFIIAMMMCYVEGSMTDK